MPRLTILSEQEAQAFQTKPSGVRKQIEAEYDTLIAPMEIGNYATVELAEKDNKPTVRNRLKAAAARRGLNAVFHRTKANDPIVVFHLEEPSIEALPVLPKKMGRMPKQVEQEAFA